MKKVVRLSESDLKKLIKRVISEQNTFSSVDNCYNMIVSGMIKNFDNSVIEAKKELQKMGGKFPQNQTPTDADWQEASKMVLRDFGYLKPHR